VISRVVIKVNHPGYFTSYGRKTRSVTVAMDNGCNFAFALAGILKTSDFRDAYFTEKFCISHVR
jgi:hypothetical protein